MTAGDVSKQQPDITAKDAKKPYVAFVCTHNSCRSQMAEAIAKHIVGDVFRAYSAGTHLKDKVNPDVVRIFVEMTTRQQAFIRNCSTRFRRLTI